MVGVPLKVSTLPSVLIGLIYLAYQYIHVYHGAGSATFNSLVENNQYSSRKRLKFLKDLSNGIVVAPKVVKRIFQPLPVISSDSECDEDVEEDDDDDFILKSNLLDRTIDSVSSTASSTIELDKYLDLLHVSPTTVSDGSFDLSDDHHLTKLEYPRPSIQPPPGL